MGTNYNGGILKPRPCARVVLDSRGVTRGLRSDALLLDLLVDLVWCGASGQAGAMSFFSPESAAPEPEEEREPYERQPTWHGPSADEVGRPIAASFVLARSEAAAVVVQSVRAFSSGCLIALDYVVRRGSETAGEWQEVTEAVFGMPRGRGHGRRGEGEDSLLFGVELADGTTARTNDYFDWRNPGPEHRLVSAGGRGGSGGSERVHGSNELWLRPLPPAPSMDLVCVWPRHGISETRRTIDTTSILDAAGHAHWIWPEDADLPEMKLE